MRPRLVIVRRMFRTLTLLQVFGIDKLKMSPLHFFSLSSSPIAYIDYQFAIRVDRRMLKRFYHRRIRILELYVFAHQRDTHRFVETIASETVLN